MIFRFFLACALGVFIPLGTAQANQWISSEGDRTASAHIEQGRLSLFISCRPNDPAFSFNLYGGPFPGMNNIDNGTESMMMWIELPDGRTARHPIDGHYFAPDQAFVGRFLVSEFVLEQFRQGARLSMTAPTGATIASFGMQGTGKARGHFEQVCGI